MKYILFFDGWKGNDKFHILDDATGKSLCNFYKSNNKKYDEEPKFRSLCKKCDKKRIK